MEIIDAQIHEPHPVLDWTDGDPEGQRSRNVELALSAMDAVGVDAAVLHASLEFCNTAFRLHPDRFRGMVDIKDPMPADVDCTVARIAEHPGLVGFRVLPCFPPDGPKVTRLKQGGYDPWFEAAERHGVPIVVFLWNHLVEAQRIARNHPSLTLVVDQVGMAPVPVAPLTADRLDRLPELLELAQFPNICLKLVGMTSLSFEEYPFHDLWDPLREIIEAFGPERIMWGADHTRLMMGPDLSRGKPVRTYADELQFVKYHDAISESAKELLLGGSLRCLYQWPGDTPSTVSENGETSCQ